VKKITAFLLTGIISVCFSQDNWIYYNKVSTETEGYFSIWRINQDGENDTLIFEMGYLLDVSEDGNFMLFANSGAVKRYNFSTVTLDDISIETYAAKFTSDASSIIYASQTELFIYNIDSQENIMISDSLSYETNFDYSAINNSVVFYEQNDIVTYNLLNGEKIVLSDNAMSIGGDGWSYLSWSPSNFIYYECTGTAGGNDEGTQICRISSQGNTQPEQITEESKFLLAPIANYSVQEKIAITELDEEFGSVLHIYNSSTDELDSLTSLEGTFINSKIWSKDNNSIIFSCYSDDFDFDSYEIWVYNISDSTLVNITNGTNPKFYQNEELNTDNNAILNKFHIMNYPNPFNPVTTLRYDLPEDAVVNITIYDMMGRVVSNLVSSQQNAGYKSIQWDATNNIGQPVSAGLYLYTIQAGEFRQTKKMVLLK
jgi:hypothetical protein